MGRKGFFIFRKSNFDKLNNVPYGGTTFPTPSASTLEVEENVLSTTDSYNTYNDAQVSVGIFVLNDSNYISEEIIVTKKVNTIFMDNEV